MKYLLKHALCLRIFRTALVCAQLIAPSGPCEVRNETEKKRNETNWNETKQIETKRNRSKQNEKKHIETKQIGINKTSEIRVFFNFNNLFTQDQAYFRVR